MSGPLTAASEPVQVASAVPILRRYDVAATIRFYVDYLGCSLDWQAGDGDRPEYLQASRGGMTLHLSSHHHDGTPGTAVLVEVSNIDGLHAELHQRAYPFLNPGIGPGPGNVREMQLIDPASNRIRSTNPHQPGRGSAADQRTADARLQIQRDPPGAKTQSKVGPELTREANPEMRVLCTATCECLSANRNS